MINRRKNSISLMKIFDKDVGKFFRQGGSLVRRHPMWLSEIPLGFVSVYNAYTCTHRWACYFIKETVVKSKASISRKL